MIASHVLLPIGGVIVAIILAFCVIGWAIRILDRPGWWIAVIVGLWVLWVLIPGSHTPLLKLWASLHGGAGVVGQGVKKVL